ncbi:MAG: hypothetical protein QXG65_04150 [Thermoplasmata archaeon]
MSPEESPSPPSSSRTFVLVAFAAGVVIAAVVATLGFYGYLGAGIP